MSHDHSSMDMGSMAMGGVPALVEFPKIYWGIIGGTVAIATVVNVINILICRHRLSAARRGSPTPAKPKNILLEANATATAIIREAASATLDPIRLWKATVPMPQVGKTFLVVANIIILTVLSFVGWADTFARRDLENIGYRTGFVCLAQIPLLFLLAGKNNIIGFLTGISYEKLNWLHRWAARTLFLFTTIHFGYWLTAWWPYGNYVSVQIRTNNLVYWGLAAWCALAWIVLSSFAPIRRLSYEIFVIQHLITFACFVGFVYMHLKPFKTTHPYIWLCVGLFFFDRLTRALMMLYINFSLFHPDQRRQGNMNGLWATKAQFTALPGNHTRITIKNPPLSWKPGQHVFVSCHSVVPLQSHPFTIASIPQDNKIEFFVKAEKGGTRRFLKHAERNAELPLSGTAQLKTVALEGPYGCIRPLRQFDSLVLFAGSTGATFTTPLLRDIVQGWKDRNTSGTWFAPAGVVTRHIRLIWVVKTRIQVSWFADQLGQVMETAKQLREEGLGVQVEISIYCTCDDSFTEEHKSFFSSISSPTAPREKGVGHGKVEELPIRVSTSSSDNDEKKETLSIREIEAPNPEPDHSAIHACGDGTCCCKATIDNENDAINATDICCCGPSKSLPSPPTSSSSRSTSTTSTPAKSLLHPQITVLAGRPNPKVLIRKSLEQARGESAVVVCGPGGLVGSVRRAVVGLSDERAVHKGTGAQGIYLHCESFNN